jgi:outer membrane protein assembly factor BamB
VTFNSAGAAFTAGSDTTITATVPAAASTGRIAVTTPGGTATSTAKFTVTPGIVLSAGSGHPGGTVTVSGAGFAAYEAVDVYLDATDEALASASGTGNFAGITLAVPSSAVPGTHYITAVGRHSGISAQAAYTVSTNWAQFRYSLRHKGANPFENVLSPATVAQIDQDWSYTTGGFVESSPAVAGGVVYVGSFDGNVYALSAATGAKLWSFTTGGFVVSSPAVADGVVYVGSGDGNVYALNAATGAKLWSFTTGSFVDSSPAVAGGVVYASSFDGNVYAFDLAGGQAAPARPRPGDLRPDYSLPEQR